MTSPERRSPAEAEFLAGYDPTVFERPSVAVDVALVTIEGDALRVVMVRRTQHPDAGTWQLPGGFVRIDESLDEAAARVLREKAGIDGVYIEQLYTFGELDRDPRTRVISVTYLALVHRDDLRLEDGPDVVVAGISVPWAGETGGTAALSGDGHQLAVAFDHERIVGLVVQRLRGKLGYTSIAFELLPSEFTLLALQRVHEAILGRPVNKDSFRRTVLATGRLEPTGHRERGVGHRPAAIYRQTP